MDSSNFVGKAWIQTWQLPMLLQVKFMCSKGIKTKLLYLVNPDIYIAS